MTDITRKNWGLDAAGNFVLISFLLISAPFSAQADQVILDDLIVDGSLCAGQDCVNGESFGFDTIRLKENNLRIRAYDTSSTSSFPSRDWQITFNDSSNGGANKFSIDDIDGGRTPFTLEAGAPSHSLYVDDGGRLGLGTSTPVVDLHVKSGNTPTLRLEQDGSSGFTAQTWDVAGNEANFFIRDATNGSTLPFRIQPGAPSNSLYIGSTGNVGIGTSGPDTSPTGQIFEVKNSAGSSHLILDGGNDQYSEFQFQEYNTTRWSVGYAGNATDAEQDKFYIYNYTNNREDLNIDNATGMVSIENGLTVTGTCTGCDAVFEPSWPLESIEEHSKLMFEKSYLPAVGPTPEGKVSIDVFQKTAGLLQELEKAHVYISQLNETINELKNRVTALEVR